MPKSNLPRIIAAAKMGVTSRIEQLLQEGADPNQVTDGKYRAIHYAAAYNRQNALRALLNDPHTMIDARAVTGETALFFAINPEIAAILLEGGADPNARACTGRTPIFTAGQEASILLLNYGANPGIPDNNGFTPLMAATRNSYTSLMRALIEAGADLHATNRWGYMATEYSLTSQVGDILRSHAQSL